MNPAGTVHYRHCILSIFSYADNHKAGEVFRPPAISYVMNMLISQTWPFSFHIICPQHAERFLNPTKDAACRVWNLTPNQWTVSYTKRRQERDRQTHRWHSAENNFAQGQKWDFCMLYSNNAICIVAQQSTAAIEHVVVGVCECVCVNLSPPLIFSFMSLSSLAPRGNVLDQQSLGEQYILCSFLHLVLKGSNTYLICSHCCLWICFSSMSPNHQTCSESEVCLLAAFCCFECLM